MHRQAAGGRVVSWAALVWLAGGSTIVGQYGGVGGFGGVSAGSAPDISSTSPSRLAFRPWLSANGTYSQILDSGVTRTTADQAFYGYGAAGGVSGGKAWERTAAGGFYTASYQRHNTSRVQRGVSQVAGLTLSHQASDKVSVFATQMMGSSLGGFGYGAPAGNFGGWGVAGAGILPQLGLFGAPVEDLGVNGLVDNEVFGTRVNFYGTSAGVTFQPTLRWGFGASANLGFVRRKGRGLQDLNSYGGGGQASYRVSERTTVGGVFRFSEFSYPKFFGGNRVYQTGIVLSHQLNPLTSVRIMAGGYRFQSTFLGRVEVEPEIAALLGVGAQLEVREQSRLGWIGGASLTRNWREWGLGVSYNHTVSPGNGVILAAKRDSVAGTMSRAFGRVSTGVFGGYYRSSGMIQNAVFTSGSFGASMGVRMFSEVYMGVNGGYSVYQTANLGDQWRRFVSVHLTWSPSDAAFRF